LIKETRASIAEGKWERVTEKLVDLQHLCRLLAESPDVSEDERDALVTGHLDINSLLSFVGRYRLGQTKTLCWLPEEQWTAINTVNGQVTAILARLSNPIPQVKHASG
jgi:hypothetical protein